MTEGLTDHGNYTKLVEAAAALLKHREGALPTQGWLRDNDKSRAALARLAGGLRLARGEA